MRKIHRESTPFRNVNGINIHRGEINQTIFRRFINTDVNNFPLIKGVQIGQYYMKEKLSQGEKEYLDEKSFLKEGNKSTLTNITRIATQRITGVDEKLRIVATIIPYNSYFADSTNSIDVNEDVAKFDIYFVLGILNSNLMQWRFKKTSANNNVSTSELQSLPFSFNKELSIKISVKVKDLLNKTGADLLLGKTQINQLVYQLYNLTEEEIKIVEGKV